jgi:hypothetical protein
MSYEFKKLSDVEVIAEPTEYANVLIEEDGVIKKVPKSSIDGSNDNSNSGSKVYYFDNSDGIWYFVDEELHNILMESYNNPTNGFPVIMIKYGDGALCTMNYFRPVNVIGGNYKNLNVVQCCLDSGLHNSINIAKTQQDAIDCENADMN